MATCSVTELEQNYVLLSPRSSPATELSVAEKRRALALLRRGWEEVHISRRQRPMFISSSLGLASAPSLSFEEFALRFVLLHHSKRSAATAPEEPEAGPAHAEAAEAGAKTTAPCR